ASQAKLSGYPSGSVNRRTFSAYSSNGGSAMSRGDWSYATANMLSESSCVNVAAQSSIDMLTRQLTVNVEVYYTGNSSTSTNKLNVALLQNNVEGPQSGGSSYNPGQILPNGNYNHMHMLRHLLTGQYGESINTTTQGTFISKTYTYTVPASLSYVTYDLQDIEVLVFVSESNENILSGSKSSMSYTNSQGGTGGSGNTCVMTAVPVTEDFESGIFPPQGWTVNNPDNSITWAKNTQTGYMSTSSAYIENSSYNSNGQQDELLMPLMDVSGVGQLSFSFDYAYKLWSANAYSDTLEVLVSNSCAGSYQSIWKTYGQNLVTTTPYYINSSWTPSGASDWKQVSIDLTPYLNGDTLSLKLRNITDYENNLYLDNINVGHTLTTAIEDAQIAEEWARLSYDENIGCIIISDIKVTDMQLEIYDITGKKIIEQGILNSEKTEIHSFRLPIQSKGIYIYGLSSPNKRELKGKIHIR
ncbi:MAG TPA: Omp28-related outer membrane protein, partial [Bacteroidetes bacterium]|nr:Omp28-related outer membrane protein [Bacteroidota bacterium]